MEAIYDQTTAGVDLSALTKLMEVTVSQQMSVIASVKIENLNGTGGNYTNRFVVNGATLLPDSRTSVSAGVTEFALQGRTLSLKAGQVLQLYLQGQVDDTNATVAVTLYDITPVTPSQLTEIGDGLSEKVLDAIADHEIVVRPTITVLGPCRQRNVKQVPTVIRPTVVSIPEVLN